MAGFNRNQWPVCVGTGGRIGSEYAFTQVPDNLRETMSFSIPDPTGTSAGLTYTISMPQIAGKKITLSFSPATANDAAVMKSLLPKQHSDGTPIQSTELPTSFPAYLINLTAELRIGEQVVATGMPLMMGKALNFTMLLTEPGLGVSIINNIVRAGEYYGIGLDVARMGNLIALKTKLETTKAKMAAQNYNEFTKDDLVGDLLYTAICLYFHELDISDEITAKTHEIIRYRVPSVGMYSLSLNVQEIFGIPKSAASKGMMMDVDRVMQAVFSKNGNMEKTKQYMLSSGSMSSALESAVPEQMFSNPSEPTKGISAVKALQMASVQGIPVYTIDSNNIAVILPRLQVDNDVKTDILNAVNSGKHVIVSESNIIFNEWTGCGYIISDPATGAGAYMISGGLNGDFHPYPAWYGWLFVFIGVLLITIGALTAEFGVGLALLYLGILYIGFGLCVVYGEDRIMQWTMLIDGLIVGGILSQAEGAAGIVAPFLLGLVLGGASIEAADMIRLACEGR